MPTRPSTVEDFYDWDRITRFGCADPDAQVGIGYVMNRMGADLVGDPRAKGLCEAIFRGL